MFNSMSCSGFVGKLRMLRTWIILFVLIALVYLFNGSVCRYEIWTDKERWHSAQKCGILESLRLFRRHCNTTDYLASAEDFTRLGCAHVDYDQHIAEIMLGLRKTNAAKVESAAAYSKQALLEAKSSTRVNETITVRPSCGRLGNTMFQVASLLGVARDNNLTPLGFDVLGKNQTIFEGLWYFDLPRTFMTPSKERCATKEPGVGIHVAETKNLSSKCGSRSKILDGCLQSWKYFYKIKNEVSQLLTFKQSVYDVAESRLHRGLVDLMKRYNGPIRPLFVGVHVRRTDFTERGWNKYGLIPAPKSYLLQTLAEAKKKYPASVVFVIGDDYLYSSQLFLGLDVHVYEKSSLPEVDMAVMHMMDIVIVSAGSYGWWCAYLSDAKEVFYYKDWPKLGSGLEERFHREDYFPPYWTGRQ